MKGDVQIDPHRFSPVVLCPLAFTYCSLVAHPEQASSQSEQCFALVSRCRTSRSTRSTTNRVTSSGPRAKYVHRSRTPLAARQRNVGTTPPPSRLRRSIPTSSGSPSVLLVVKSSPTTWGFGIIIVQGRHVMSDAVLRAAAGDMTFWLHQDDLDQCMMRYLKARSLWKFPEDSPATIRSHLADFCATNRGLYSKFRHHEHYAHDQRQSAKHVLNAQMKTVVGLTEKVASLTQNYFR